MDQDLKDYLDRQFTDLRQEVRQELSELRQSTEGQFGEVRQELSELRQSTEGQFGEARQETSELRQSTESQFSELRDEVHKTRILTEDLRHMIQAVAEGVGGNTETMRQLHEENQRKLRELRGTMEASHRHLDSRVANHDDQTARLGYRVNLLERVKS